MAANSSSIPWESSWTEEPGGLQFTGSQKSQTRLSDSTSTIKSHSRASLMYRKGNKNPKKRKKGRKQRRDGKPTIYT